MKLRYSVYYSDFQPNTKNTGSILLSLAPKGSFIGSLKIHAHTKFTGGTINEVRITAITECGTYTVIDSLNVAHYPVLPISPPNPIRRNVLISSFSTQKIKLNIEVRNGTINNITEGIFDIEFELNEILIPYTLECIFKTPLAVYSLKKLLSTSSNRCLTVRRVSDNASKYFYFINNFIDNASIIAWLAGSQATITRFWSQVTPADNLFSSNADYQPSYSPINSLLTFDGINDRMIISPNYSLMNHSTIVRHTPNSNHILGSTATVNAGIISNFLTTIYKNYTNLKTFNVIHNGLKNTIITVNSNIVNCFINNTPANENPATLNQNFFYLSQVGIRRTDMFFNGNFDMLIVYDSPLYKSEIEIINSI